MAAAAAGPVLATRFARLARLRASAVMPPMYQPAAGGIALRYGFVNPVEFDGVEKALTVSVLPSAVSK